MQELNDIVSPETQALILQALALASLLLPIAERIAAKTATKVDDKIVSFVGKILSVIPRVRLGK